MSVPTFYYNGNFYSCGTKIKLKQKYLDTHTYNREPIWPYAKFDNKVIRNHTTYFVFKIADIDTHGEWRRYSGYFLICATNLEDAIEKIISPVIINIKQNLAYCQTSEKKNNESKVFTILIYICVLIASLIFKEFYIIWAIASFVLYKWSENQ